MISLIKGYYSKYIKNSHNLISEKRNSPVKKWAEDLNRYLPKEDIKMANIHIKTYSASLIIQFSSAQPLSHVQLFATP